MTALLSTIWTSANLTQIFVLTGGGPNDATTTLPLLAYLVAIPGHELGDGRGDLDDDDAGLHRSWSTS